MCGIFGLLQLNRHPVDLASAEKAVCTLRHRGPDDEGYLLANTTTNRIISCGGKDTARDLSLPIIQAFQNQSFDVLLGHRRLAIIDLSSAGHQPMAIENDRYWIVYNGEIYNYIELREELESAGYHFRSLSDTEVMLYAYRHWGVSCLQHFNGMFAFILFDAHSKKIFAARDRFGVKPLYFWHVPGKFIALASEIKSFFVFPDWKSRLNGQRTYDYLNWGVFDHTDETLFSGVRQLRGGEYVELSCQDNVDALPIKKWYHLKPQPYQGDYGKAVQEFRELFFDAVKIRLRADVQVGSCLSGGLDSSSIVCVANRFLRETDSQHAQKVFSARSSVKRFDEGEFIREVVALTGVEGHETFPSLNDLFATVDQLTYHQDEPFGSTSIYAQWHVFKLVKSCGVKVLLDGQGADELLCGYLPFFAPRFAGLFTNLSFLQFFREIRAASRIHGLGLMYAILSIFNTILPEQLLRPLKQAYGSSRLTPSWLDMERLGAQPKQPSPEGRQISRNVGDLSYDQITRAGLPMLLHWEDRSSMAHSVESRIPFLDYRLVEFIFGLPEDFKISHGVTKRVLRNAMEGILPEKVQKRMDKIGFATPEEVWVRGKGTSIFRTEMENAIEASAGILNSRTMDEFEAMVTGRKKFNFLIWRMINFGRWMKGMAVVP